MPTNYNEYNKNTWVNNQTKLNESNMNNLEIAIQETRANSIDTKLLLDQLVSAIKNNTSISYNSATKTLSLSIGNNNQTNVNTKVSTRIDLTADALDKVNFFLNQVSTSYQIYDNIIDYTIEDNILNNIKIYQGIITSDADYITYHKINVDNFKQFATLPEELYISSSDNSLYPVYSLTFYDNEQELISYTMSPTAQTSIPANTQYISVTLYNTTKDTTRVALTEQNYGDYPFYKVNPNSVSGIEKLNAIDSLLAHVLNQNNPHNITKEILDIDEIYDDDGEPTSERFKTWLKDIDENDIIDLELQQNINENNEIINTLVAQDAQQEVLNTTVTQGEEIINTQAAENDQVNTRVASGSSINTTQAGE